MANEGNELLNEAMTFNEEYYIKYRAVSKRKLSLVQKAIERFENDYPNGDINIIKGNLAKLPSIMEQYDQNQIILEVNSSDPERHFLDRESFTESFDVIMARITDIIESNCKESSPVHSDKSDVNTNIGLQLPSLTLQSFDGTVKNWINYRDMFISLVKDNTNLNDIQRLHYLRSSLMGEASELISSLPLTSNNFIIAWNLLYERYNNNTVILSYHLKSLLNLPRIKSGTASEFRDVINQLSSNSRAVESLLNGVPFHEALLSEILLDKLRRCDRQEWDLRHSRSAFNLKDLIKYIEAKAQSLELNNFRENDLLKCTSDKAAKQNKSPKTFTVTSAVCLYCNKANHMINVCRDFAALNVKQRKDFIISKSACFACLRKHSFYKCKSKCSICNRKHHQLLHIDFQHDDQHVNSENVPQVSTETFVGLRTKSNSETSTLLPTAMINVTDFHGNIVQARAILDSCSMKSFISSALVKKLKLPIARKDLKVSGINGSSAASIMYTCNLKLICQDDNSSIHVNCAVLDHITSTLPHSFVNISDWNIPNDVILADSSFNKPGEIDLLLDADVFFNVIIGSPLKRKGFPTLISTKFGYIVSGQLPQKCFNSVGTNICCLTRTNVLETQIRKFWELEEMHDMVFTKEDRFCEQHFKENTVRNSEGRFIVRLPVRLEVQIGETRNKAVKRLSILERKFSTDTKLFNEYDAFMKEYLKLGHMELISDETHENEFILPHHAIFKPSSSTTKVRIVFDGSALSSNKYSLNDILCVGPTVQDDLFSILLRFRKFPVALVGDIEKMYRQILVDTRDRRFQRILWRSSTNEPIETYQLMTVTYGTPPASFLSTRCLNQLAEEGKEEFPLAAESLASSFYADDLLQSCSTTQEAIKLYQELTDLLSTAGFPIRKWSSNDFNVIQEIDTSVREKRNECKSFRDSTISTLGILWNPSTDKFQFPCTMKSVNRLTKRNILSALNPADIISCGVLPRQLSTLSLWLSSPEFLMNSDLVIPAFNNDVSNEFHLKDNSEFKNHSISLIVNTNDFINNIICKYSNIGIEDEVFEELPRACIVRELGTEVSEDEIKEYVAREVSPYKRLSCGVTFVAAIPKTTTGKINRRELRKLIEVTDVKTGEMIGSDCRGELCFRGPLFMKEYMRNVEETQKAFDSDGWFHSGDLGYHDGDGYFYIVDRLKELIKYQGYQVSPSELESVLIMHPVVQDAAIIGIWESEVKSIKNQIKKVIGLTILTFEEYCTLLCLIESCLNSRPLCATSDDVSSSNPITPSHFLLGRSVHSIYEPSLIKEPINRLSRWQHLQVMFQHFWSSWSYDYLLELQKRAKWCSSTTNMEEGQIVLVKDDHVPPLYWPLGRITDLFPGKDGKDRVVNVIVRGKIFKRPIVKIVPLPFD